MAVTPHKQLEKPQPLFNIDGTENKSRNLQFYTDLEIQTGTQRRNHHFFLLDLGEHKAILRYLWFTATQPKIDWARGWIDSIQLPIIFCAPNARKACFALTRIVGKQRKAQAATTECYFIRWVVINPPKPTNKGVPPEYQRHTKVFSEEESQWLLNFTIWDHTIELLPEAPNSLPGWLLPLMMAEKEEAHKFMKEHLSRGTIQVSKSPYAANFFFIKKKDRKLCPI
jgi:hypothetical protein